jgi:hypothetical protein
VNPKRVKYVAFSKHPLVNTWSECGAIDDEHLTEMKELFPDREWVVYKRVEEENND